VLLNGVSLEWVNSVKYFGIMFTTGTALHVDCSYIKRKFYAACNTVLCKCKYADEFVKLALIKSSCLSLLTSILYRSIGALQLPHYKVRELVFAGMTPSVEFFDTTNGSQSPSCNICVVIYHLNMYSDVQGNSINSAIKINDNSIDILRVKCGGHGPIRCSRKVFVRQYLGVLVCGCKYCIYSLSVFAVYTCGE